MEIKFIAMKDLLNVLDTDGEIYIEIIDIAKRVLNPKIPIKAINQDYYAEFEIDAIYQVDTALYIRVVAE